VTEAAERVRSPFNTSSLAQAAALGALADETYAARTREHNRAELRFVQDRLSQMGVRFIPSVANFVLVDTGVDGDAMFDALLRQGVIVRPMKAYDFPNSLRVTMGTRAENEAFLAALGKALEFHKSMTL
jgi:histidinol-phosphate aminotransferase